MLRPLALRLRALARRSALEREMRDEMEAHLARAADRLVARGMSPEAAQLAARREFGNVGVLQEEGRDARGTRWVDSLLGDVRFALRHFARRPLFAVTIILVLALGIGGHAAVFAMIQAYTMRPASGVPRDAALVHVRGKVRYVEDDRWMPREFSYPEFREIASLNETFAAVGGWIATDGVVETGDGGDRRHGRVNFITDNYFSALGLRLVLGPGLAPTENLDKPDLTAIIGYALWRDAFGERADAIGKMIRVNGVPVRIVGVAPPRFNGALPVGGSRVVWLPLSARAPLVRGSAQALTSRDSTVVKAFARLAPMHSTEEATAAVRVVAARSVAQMTPSPTAPVSVARDADVVPLRGDTMLPVRNDTAVLAGVFGSAAFLILLVACTNVSALVVGAAVARRQEIAIRLSLGASRVRVVRQLITESALLAIAGGLLGLLIFWWITRIVASQVNDVDLTPDFTTVAFTVVFALGTGIFFGLSPALHATRRGVADALKDSGAGVTKRSRLQRSFVVAQIVLTQPLLVGLAMLIGVATGSQSGRSTGVDDRIIFLRLATYVGPGSFEEKRSALAQLMNELAGIPGVEQVTHDAQSYNNSTLTVHPDDRGALPRASEPTFAHIEVIGPGYFKALDIPILRGRDLAPTDTRDHAVIIGDDFARALWGSADPIGRRFTQKSRFESLDRDLVVIGVYDSRYETTRGAGIRVFAASDGRVRDALLIRTAGPAAPLVAPIRAMVHANRPTTLIAQLETWAQDKEDNRREAMQVSGAAAAGGILALVLASIGLYGVVALAVGQRRREIGIRMALGARAEQVVGLLFSSGLRLCTIGLVLGLPLSLFALRLIAEQVRLPETSMIVVGGAIATVVLFVACVATWIPARRAASVDPVSALRAE